MIFENSSGTRLNYVVTGEGKTQILFLHGFCASLLTWDYIKDYFDKKKFTLIFVDLLGHGNSSTDKNTDYSILSQTKIVFELINFLKLNNFILTGHSYGGSISLLLNILYSQQINIQKMILLNAGAYADEIPFFVRHLKNPVISFLSFFTVIVPKSLAGKIVLKNLYFNKKLVTKDRIDRYIQFFSKSQINAIISIAKKIIPDNFEELIKKYSQINIPALIIWGKNDSIISLNAAKKINSDLKNSKLQIIENCGHIPQEEKPEETFKIIKKFLE